MKKNTLIKYYSQLVVSIEKKPAPGEHEPNSKNLGLIKIYLTALDPNKLRPLVYLCSQ